MASRENHWVGLNTKAE